jgi:inorganic pyrophosphatase
MKYPFILIKIKSVSDLPSQWPKDIMEWFKVYKTYDGKAENKIGFDGKLFSKEDALRIVH